MRKKNIFQNQTQEVCKCKKFANIITGNFFLTLLGHLCLLQCKILLDFSLFVAQDGIAAGWHLPD